MVQPKLNQMMSDFIIPYIKEPRMILVPLTYTWNVIPHIIPRDKNDSCPSNLYIECYTIHSSSFKSTFLNTHTGFHDHGPGPGPVQIVTCLLYIGAA